MKTDVDCGLSKIRDTGPELYLTPVAPLLRRYPSVFQPIKTKEEKGKETR